MSNVREEQSLFIISVATGRRSKVGSDLVTMRQVAKLWALGGLRGVYAKLPMTEGAIARYMF